jgi:hypothetical protein
MAMCAIDDRCRSWLRATAFVAALVLPACNLNPPTDDPSLTEAPMGQGGAVFGGGGANATGGGAPILSPPGNGGSANSGAGGTTSGIGDASVRGDGGPIPPAPDTGLDGGIDSGDARADRD